MPLRDGDSPDIISENIRELIAAGHAPDQAAAIAYAHAKSRRLVRVMHNGQHVVRTDDVPSHVVSLARAHALALKQRTKRGHFVPGHGVRGRVPRAMPPDAIEANFAAAIKRVIATPREHVAKLMHELKSTLAHRSDAAELAPPANATDSSSPIVARRNVAGFAVAIENAAGSKRTWTDSDGSRGWTLMRWDYGFIVGAIGADGEDVDVYIGPIANPEWVFVIHQRCKADGFKSYDEDKVMLGWPSADAAKAAYLAQYDDPHFFGGMSVFTLDEFRAKLRDIDGGKITHTDADDFSSADRARLRAALDRARRDMEQQLTTNRLSNVAAETASHLSTFNAAQFSRQVRAAIGTDISLRDPKIAGLLDEFVHANVSLIRALGNKSLDDVEKAIVNGVASGDSWSGIQDDVQERYGISDRHAQLIARDQVGKLNGQITRARHEELGVSKYKWRDSGDNKVRPSHKKLNGKTFSYAKPPLVDGERKNPGEPICCRCSPEPVFDDVKAAIAQQQANALTDLRSRVPSVSHSAKSRRKRSR